MKAHVLWAVFNDACARSGGSTTTSFVCSCCDLLSCLSHRHAWHLDIHLNCGISASHDPATLFHGVRLAPYSAFVSHY